MSWVNWPGIATEITPAQVHISLQVLFSAGWLVISTLTAPGTHGAGVTGTQGIGVNTPIAAAVAAMTRVAETRDPDPGNHAIYEELYRSVYLRMYDRLRPLYAEIRRITGYPPEV